eukprot:3066402-Prymnesium_polylepis.1
MRAAPYARSGEARPIGAHCSKTQPVRSGTDVLRRVAHHLCAFRRPVWLLREVVQLTAIDRERMPALSVDERSLRPLVTCRPVCSTFGDIALLSAAHGLHVLAGQRDVYLDRAAVLGKRHLNASRSIDTGRVLKHRVATHCCGVLLARRRH